MANEQSIENLKKLKSFHNGSYGSDIDRAIKALKQEPCEDAISRQALLDAFGFSEKTRKWGGDHSGYDTMMLYEIQDMIESAPSVKPQESKTGHWIEYTRVLIPNPINKWEQAWYCSECGYGNQECEDGSAWLEWNYCPNCGCRMVDPQERSDKE